jgi:hypothetical protein
VAIDNKDALDITGGVKPWDFFGLDYIGSGTNSERSAIISRYATNMVKKMTSDYELMDSVSAFRIIPLNSDDFDSSSHFAKVRPDAIKIELTLYDAEKVSKDLPEDRQKELKKENSRLFSKVIFFNDMR